MRSVRTMGKRGRHSVVSGNGERTAPSVEELISRMGATAPGPSLPVAPSGFVEDPFQCVENLASQTTVNGFVDEKGAALPALLLESVRHGIGGITEEKLRRGFESTSPAKAMVKLYEDAMADIGDRLHQELYRGLSERVDPDTLTGTFSVHAVDDGRDQVSFRLEMHRSIVAELDGAAEISDRLPNLCELACVMLGKMGLPILSSRDMALTFHSGAELLQDSERIARALDEGEDAARAVYESLIEDHTGELEFLSQAGWIPGTIDLEGDFHDDLFAHLIKNGQRLRELEDFLADHSDMTSFSRLVSEMTEAELDSPFGRFVRNAHALAVEYEPLSESLRELVLEFHDGEAFIDSLIFCKTERGWSELLHSDLLSMIQECGEQPAVNLSMSDGNLERALVFLGFLLRCFVLVLNADQDVCDSYYAASANCAA